ncbi:unnamed protein product [Urochloa humidicola]
MEEGSKVLCLRPISMYARPNMQWRFLISLRSHGYACWQDAGCRRYGHGTMLTRRHGKHHGSPPLAAGARVRILTWAARARSCPGRGLAEDLIPAAVRAENLIPGAARGNGPAAVDLDADAEGKGRGESGAAAGLGREGELEHPRPWHRGREGLVPDGGAR